MSLEQRAKEFVGQTYGATGTDPFKMQTDCEALAYRFSQFAAPYEAKLRELVEAADATVGDDCKRDVASGETPGPECAFCKLAVALASASALLKGEE